MFPLSTTEPSYLCKSVENIHFIIETLKKATEPKHPSQKLLTCIKINGFLSLLHLLLLEYLIFLFAKHNRAEQEKTDPYASVPVPPWKIFLTAVWYCGQFEEGKGW